MFTAHESRALAATLIFDLEDHYARDALMRSPHPRPIDPIQFWLIGQMVGGARQTLDQPVEMVTKRNASGYHLFFGQFKQTDGSLRREWLADGAYIVEVRGRFYQSTERSDISLPMNNPNDPASAAPYRFELEPGYAYPFPDAYPLRLEGGAQNCAGLSAPGRRGPTLLRGRLCTAAGEGVAGARVRVANQSNEYTTDKTGQWVLWFPDNHSTGIVTVEVIQAGAVATVSNVCVVQGRETSLFQTSLRGWVLRAGIGVAGASVAVSGGGGPIGSVAAGAAGAWAYYFDLAQPPAGPIDVTANLPDGRSLSAAGVPVRPRATVVVPSFRFP